MHNPFSDSSSIYSSTSSGSGVSTEAKYRALLPFRTSSPESSQSSSLPHAPPNYSKHVLLSMPAQADMLDDENIAWGKPKTRKSSWRS